jgi:uncharacterized Fe-S cluster protein YjdI
MDYQRSESSDREYKNDEITVYWKPSKCIHATTCYHELIEVFNPRKRPWIDLEGAHTEEIIRVVKLCPTQALAFKYNNEILNDTESNHVDSQSPKPAEVPATEVKVMKDGPLVITGNFKIFGADGNELRHMKMASFCRCGHSKNMPFCDGTHRKVSFSADL